MMIFNKEREGGMVVTIILKNTVKAVRYNTCFMLFAFGFMVKLANFIYCAIKHVSFLR